jgi:hypothetical protein
LINITADYDVVQTLAKELDQLPNLHNILKNGISAILYHEENDGAVKHNNLLSIIGFERTLNNPETIKKAEATSIPAEAKMAFVKEAEKKSEGAGGDDEVTEIKYVPVPAHLNEITANTKLVAISNDKSILPYFHLFGISYEFNSLSTSVKTLVEERLMGNNLVIIQAHLPKPEDPLTASLLGTIDEVTGALIARTDNIHLRVTLGPAFAGLPKESVLNPHHYQTSKLPEAVQSFIKKVEPIQIWQTLQAELDSTLKTEKSYFSLAIVFDTLARRVDRLDAFAKLNSIEGLSLIGYRTIRAPFFFREILFTLGKIPKFGA